jgi:hypothetical protein
MDDKGRERPKGPSLREFDYFSDGVRPAAGEALAEAELPEALEAQAEAFRRGRRRAASSAVTASLLVAACTWFVWGQRDDMTWAFSGPRAPLRLGDVVDLTPADIPANAYVELSGITEHRGLTEKVVRGLWPVRDERWYFRLVGSRGVFLETAPDPKRFGMITSLTVRGRAVDPNRSGAYRAFLEQYQERFNARGQEVARIIQVDAAPGEGRLQYVVFLAFIALLAAFDAWSLWGYVRYRRASSGFLR